MVAAVGGDVSGWGRGGGGGGGMIWRRVKPGTRCRGHWKIIVKLSCLEEEGEITEGGGRRDRQEVVDGEGRGEDIVRVGEGDERGEMDGEGEGSATQGAREAGAGSRCIVSGGSEDGAAELVPTRRAKGVATMGGDGVPIQKVGEIIIADGA